MSDLVNVVSTQFDGVQVLVVNSPARLSRDAAAGLREEIAHDLAENVRPDPVQDVASGPLGAVFRLPGVGGLLARVCDWLIAMLFRLGILFEVQAEQQPVDGRHAAAPAAVDDLDVPPFAVVVRPPGRHSVDTVPPERAVRCLAATFAERQAAACPDPPPIVFEPYVDFLPEPNHTPLTVLDTDLQDPEPQLPDGRWLVAGGGYGGPGGPGLDRRPETLADLSALHTYPMALEAAR